MRAFALVTLAAATVSTSTDFALPTFDGRPVVDPAGALSSSDRTAVERRLYAEKDATGNEIVVFIVPTLAGRTIEDVAYEAFNRWGIGDAGEDNGVLLVLAPKERRLRIETGKGTEAALTDIESVEILRQVVAPRMRAGQLREAILEGVGAIAATLRQEGVRGPRAERPPVTRELPPTLLVVLGVFLLLWLTRAGSNRRWRGGGFGGPFIGGGMFGGGMFGGGGGRGGGGFGGGGSSGGGGASSNY